MRNELGKISLSAGLSFLTLVSALGCGTSGKKVAAKDAAAGELTDARAGLDGLDGPADGAVDLPADAIEPSFPDAGVDQLSTDALPDGPPDALPDGLPDGPADSAPDALPGPIATVSTFGCFARSGDGNDHFLDGTAAVILTNSPYRAPCDLGWVGLDPNGYTKPTVPSTENIVRRFVIDELISDRATITVSFEVDDAAELVLNGKLIASCTPPPGNAGECQSSCHLATFSKDDLLPPGQVNVLEVKMINLQNTTAPGGHTGYTGISYSICAQGE